MRFEFGFKKERKFIFFTKYKQCKVFGGYKSVSFKFEAEKFELF